jgi:hypothetical protein
MVGTSDERDGAVAWVNECPMHHLENRGGGERVAPVIEKPGARLGRCAWTVEGAWTRPGDSAGVIRMSNDPHCSLVPFWSAVTLSLSPVVHIEYERRGSGRPAPVLVIVLGLCLIRSGRGS